MLASFRRIGIFTVALAASAPAFGQANAAAGYDDYANFATDPVELDQEVSDLFGRFFQNSFQVGTNILTGGLGQAYSAGVLLQLKFVFYFDKIWAGELGIGWAQQSGIYNKTNTGKSGITINTKMSMVPINLGIRYGFDHEVLPRGFAVINPYISATVEYVFRSEGVSGIPDLSGFGSGSGQTYNATKFAQGSVTSNNGYGASIGGGLEFDVYRKKMYLGLDLRYHLLFWSDGGTFVGNLDREGHAVSILGALTYNY